MWFKIHDGLCDDPKIVAAGNTAIGVWVRCGSWSMKQLTDGFIPNRIARLYGRKRDFERLVEVGLWIPCDGGFQFAKWERYQPTKAKVEAEREAAAERKRRSRESFRGGLSVVQSS